MGCRQASCTARVGPRRGRVPWPRCFGISVCHRVCVRSADQAVQLLLCLKGDENERQETNQRADVDEIPILVTVLRLATRSFCNGFHCRPLVVVVVVFVVGSVD